MMLQLTSQAPYMLTACTSEKCSSIRMNQFTKLHKNTLQHRQQMARPSCSRQSFLDPAAVTSSPSTPQTQTPKEGKTACIHSFFWGALIEAYLPLNSRSRTQLFKRNQATKRSRFAATSYPKFTRHTILSFAQLWRTAFPSHNSI